MASQHYPTLEELLEQGRLRIEVTPDELAEARKRRTALALALEAEFVGSRSYVNGSVAHGDALTPLTDVDLGVVVAGAEQTHGPGKKGPADLKERAAAAIKERLKPAYGDLRVEVEGRKRSILVRFRDPVRPGLPDFTADVIIAVDNLTGAGLYIPRHAGWDRSHPEKHTELVLEAITNTAVAFARIVRLLKHWNRRHDKPLCSWNVKALALGCITGPMTLLAGLRIWFDYAITELAKGETEDPAHVGPHPIKLGKPRSEVLTALQTAQKRLAEAVALEQAGYPLLAHDELAKLFNDDEFLPLPDQQAVRAEEARRFTARGGAAAVTGTGLGASRPRIPARSWAP